MLPKTKAEDLAPVSKFINKIYSSNLLEDNHAVHDWVSLYEGWKATTRRRALRLCN